MNPILDIVRTPVVANKRSSFLFHLAVRENNTGVDFYNNGDYKSSIDSLHRALGWMKQFFKCQQQARSEEAATNTRPRPAYRPRSYGENHHVASRSEESTVSSETVVERDKLAMAPVLDSLDCGNVFVVPITQRNANASKEPLDRNNCLPLQNHPGHNTRHPHDNIGSDKAISVNIAAIYHSALYLKCQGDCWEAIINPSLACSREDLARIRASILFNLGLVHHIQAGMSDATVATMLGKTILFYELSLSIQESEQAPISHLYLMALCNNIGQCRSSLFQHSKARAWNERLLSLMVCHRQNYTHTRELNRPHNYECFVQNTMSHILGDTCLSPAA